MKSTYQSVICDLHNFDQAGKADKGYAVSLAARLKSRCSYVYILYVYVRICICIMHVYVYVIIFR